MTNSVDLDQTAHMSSLIRICTVCSCLSVSKLRFFYVNLFFLSLHSQPLRHRSSSRAVVLVAPHTSILAAPPSITSMEVREMLRSHTEEHHILNLSNQVHTVHVTLIAYSCNFLNEPPHDKTNRMIVHPAKN